MNVTYSVLVLFLLLFFNIDAIVGANYSYDIRNDMPRCCNEKLLSCNLAIEALDAYTKNGISWSSMIDENATHNGWYLVIDSNGKVKMVAATDQRYKNTGWFGHQRDFQRIELIAKREPSLRNIIIPLNRQDAPVSRWDGIAEARPKISFCGLPSFQDILWPSSQFERGKTINADDYNIDETKWMEKIDRAWFRGSMNGFKKGRVSIMNETLSFPHLVDAGIVNTITCQVEPTKRLCLPAIMKPVMPLHEAVQKYRYIIDIDGHCAAMRLQEILGRNVAVIKVQSDERQWYSSKLIPWIHYVPITLTPFRVNPTALYNSIRRNRTIPQHSTTREAIEWTQKHPKETFEIILNSHKFYEDYLTEDAVQCYIETILRSIMKLYRFSVTERLTLLKFEHIWNEAAPPQKRRRRTHNHFFW
jgi:hypothetical protein